MIERRSPGRRALVGLELRRLWRALEIALGIRKISPRPGERLPWRTVIVPELGDTGGGYRPSHRQQDPSVDPREPNGSESSSTGSDHGWAGCTASAGADALAYHTAGELTPWGGDLRHRQSDLSGGIDLYDLRDAWATYGETLTIRSGSGWSAVSKAHGEGRAIVIQGSGNVPGTESFDGGHACCIGIETRSSDGYWLWGDPLASGWQYVSPSSIRTWAERWQSSVAFAVSRIVESEPAPEPGPPPPPAPATPYGPADLAATARYAGELGAVIAGDVLVGAWAAYLEAPKPGPADAWAVGAWADPVAARRAQLLGELVGDEPDPCEPGSPASWSRDPVPMPIPDALAAISSAAAWGASSWRAALWRV